MPPSTTLRVNRVTTKPHFLILSFRRVDSLHGPDCSESLRVMLVEPSADSLCDARWSFAASGIGCVIAHFRDNRLEAEKKPTVQAHALLAAFPAEDSFARSHYIRQSCGWWWLTLFMSSILVTNAVISWFRCTRMIEFQIKTRVSKSSTLIPATAP